MGIYIRGGEMGAEWKFCFDFKDKTNLKTEGKLQKYQVKLKEIEDSFNDNKDTFSSWGIESIWYGDNPKDNIFGVVTFECTNHANLNIGFDNKPYYSVGSKVKAESLEDSVAEFNGKEGRVVNRAKVRNAYPVHDNIDDFVGVRFPVEDSKNSDTEISNILHLRKDHIHLVNPNVYTHNWTLLWNPTKNVFWYKDDETFLNINCCPQSKAVQFFTEQQKELVPFGFVLELSHGISGNGNWSKWFKTGWATEDRGYVYYLKCSCKGKCNTDKCTCRSSEPKMDCIDLCTCSNSCENCDPEEGKSIE